MFCPKCGTAAADTATSCGSCHAPLHVGTAAAIASVAGPGPGAPAAASLAAGAARSAARDAVTTLRTLAPDPVGGMPRVYTSLGEPRALRAGVALGVLSLVCFLAGGYLTLPPFLREDLFEFLGFGGTMKCLLFGVVPFACTAAGSVAVRKWLGGSAGRSGYGGDALTAGAALAPVSLAMLLSGLLGLANAEVVGLLAVFAGCTAILLLFSGYTRIAGLSERAGALAVPLVVVLAAWLAKVLAASVLTPSGTDEMEMPFILPY